MAPMVLLQCMWFQQADNSEKALKATESWTGGKGCTRAAQTGKGSIRIPNADSHADMLPCVALPTYTHYKLICPYLALFCNTLTYIRLNKDM